jgi:hypothetical protein
MKLSYIFIFELFEFDKTYYFALFYDQQIFILIIKLKFLILWIIYFFLVYKNNLIRYLRSLVGKY